MEGRGCSDEVQEGGAVLALEGRGAIWVRAEPHFRVLFFVAKRASLQCCCKRERGARGGASPLSKMTIHYKHILARPESHHSLKVFLSKRLVFWFHSPRISL